MIVLPGCSHMQQAEEQSLLDTNWQLSKLLGENMKYSDAKIPQLRFEAERVTGNDGCNNFFGDYTLEGDRLEFGMLASTRMACPHMEGFEIIFNKTLSMTTHYRISGDRLDLLEGDNLLASFLAAEQQ